MANVRNKPAENGKYQDGIKTIEASVSSSPAQRRRLRQDELPKIMSTTMQ